MTRGHTEHTKIHYQGKDHDFIIFAESVEMVNKWKSNKSVPMAEVVNGWKIFTTSK